MAAGKIITEWILPIYYDQCLSIKRYNKTAKRTDQINVCSLSNNFENVLDKGYRLYFLGGPHFRKQFRWWVFHPLTPQEQALLFHREYVVYVS